MGYSVILPTLNEAGHIAKLIERIKFNLSAMNVLNDIHRELIGGAKMGRQVVMRVSSEFWFRECGQSIVISL